MTDRTKAPATVPAGLYCLPGTEVRVLDNGVRLHVYRGGDQPISTLRIIFDGGYTELGSKPLQSLYSSQITEGSVRRPASEVAGILDFNGARYGISDGPHHTGFAISMLDKKAPDIISLIDELYSAPLFGERELAAARLSLAAQLKFARSRVQTAAREALASLIFGENHPQAQITVEEQITAIDSHALHSAHRKLCNACGCHAFLSGMVTQQTEVAVTGFLQTLRTDRGAMHIQSTPYVAQAPQTVSIERPDAIQSAIVAALPAVPRTHPDYLPLRLTVMALGGYFGSRLMTNIRENKGLTYGISAALCGTADGAYVAIDAQCDNSFVNSVIDGIREEMLALRSNPPRGEELERLRLHASTDALETLDSPDSIMAFHATMHTVGIPDGYFDAQQRAVAALDSDTIARMASLYLSPDSLRIAIAGSAR